MHMLISFTCLSGITTRVHNSVSAHSVDVKQHSLLVAYFSTRICLVPNIFRADNRYVHRISNDYLRRTVGYTRLNHKRNEEILEELHVTPLEDKLCTYRHKWFHVHKMEDNRLPKQLMDYHPKEDDDLDDHLRDY
jgi:hypothetical protein